MRTVSLVTNACVGDAGRLRVTIPHWLRHFGDRVDEIVVAVDAAPAAGRIAALHGAAGDLAAVYSELEQLTRQDARVRSFTIEPATALEPVGRKWFGGPPYPERCQAGTPVFAFACAVDAARHDLVLRCDCDMLFREGGWLAAAADLLLEGSLDLVEPPRCGESGPAISSRAFLLHRTRFSARCLPLRHRKLDALRRVHRWLQGRPPWLALEQMLDADRVAGRIRHRVLPPELGFSLHVALRSDMELPEIPAVVAAVERGAVPSAQRHSWNFAAEAWR